MAATKSSSYWARAERARYIRPSDRELNRFVALKLIRSDLASNPAILARFKQELLTAHKVTHKNVIRIYDLAEADDVRFITMEYVEGCDLRRLLLASTSRLLQ